VAYALGMKINEIKIGMEVRICGQWAVVDAIEDGIVYGLDQDGGELSDTVGNVEIA
jgi:hypothetical protein